MATAIVCPMAEEIHFLFRPRVFLATDARSAITGEEMVVSAGVVMY
jgi:hypothetical protein